MSRPGSVAWLGHHELRLAWRDWLVLLTGGRPRRTVTILVGVAAFAAFMHVVAAFLVGRFADVGTSPPRDFLIAATAIGLLSWSLLVSQAVEAVTRAFYARADLDLLLSSPLPPARIFAVRIAAIAITSTAMAALFAGPFINVLAWYGGVRWLAGYGVAAAAGVTAATIAVWVTMLLFRTLGARRTRLAAQIVAAMIGALFVLGLQGAAILTYGTFASFTFLQSEWLAAVLPGQESIVWMPARAITGDLAALAGVMVASFGALAATVGLFGARFGAFAAEAAGVSRARPRRRRVGGVFRRTTPAEVLRRKEWLLLRRDPWLVSQTLMQLLYLLPAGLLLWLEIGHDSGAMLVIVPVIVVAAGQLAGGLAWLAVSGEDAPDLVGTAPMPERAATRAKVEAVLAAIAVVAAPLVLLVALSNPWAGLVAATVIAAATVQAVAIQLAFRAQAKRSQFRNRQTASRVATFAEAFSSMAWAATAGVAIAGNWPAAGTAAVGAVAILLLARAFRPAPSGEGRAASALSRRAA